MVGTIIQTTDSKSDKVETSCLALLGARDDRVARAHEQTAVRPRKKRKIADIMTECVDA